MQFRKITLLILTTFILLSPAFSQDWTPKVVDQDPLLRMPGTQPAEKVTLEDSAKCLVCHAGYGRSVEPGFQWKGSMMAQASRDFIFWATMTVAMQDSIQVLGNPNAADLCERCHFPSGWLQGRSDPPNASKFTGADYDGLTCDFCHRMVDPFFETIFDGTREGNDWVGHWDETNKSPTPSQTAAQTTLAEDRSLTAPHKLFNGDPFFKTNASSQILPFSPDYTEAASGQFFISPNNKKRAGFADAKPTHPALYSRFHKSKHYCGTCHDISNPALANLKADPAEPLPTEKNSASAYFHVERTFSEFMLSAYAQPSGAPGSGAFSPTSLDTDHPDNHISKCQDCHMQNTTGRGSRFSSSPIRPDESIEHPHSGQPRHDTMGGNAFGATVLASVDPVSPNYDPINDTLLSQGAAVLTLDLNQGQGLDGAALLAAAQLAKSQLQSAASIENLAYNRDTGALAFQVRNHTGHKLISGFPEGRRMFLNIKALDAAGKTAYEINPFDAAAGTLKGLPGQNHYVDTDKQFPALPDPAALTTQTEIYLDELVYESLPSSTITGEDHSFHFALADGRYKDNRIPPKGFQIDGAAERLVDPVSHGVSAPDYFTAAEYAGGYDAVNLTIPSGLKTVEVSLYYQTTSREYIEFLRNEINGVPRITLDPSAYIIQSDPFFTHLKAWGDTIWKLWKHNYQSGVEGATPILMTTTTTAKTTAQNWTHYPLPNPQP